MKKHIQTILFMLSVLFCGAKSNAQLPAPKLVVGIVVDQMRPDYVMRYWNKFGNGGFKRLAREGFNCRNTQYPYCPTFTGPGHASIYTGTTPAVHGIVANDWFERSSNDTVYCAQDDTVKCVGCENEWGKMSPARLLTTTVTDELQWMTRGKAKVIGISLKDRGAIMPAGRMADAAYWYDGVTGNWITSTWYRNELPQWVNDFNNHKWPAKYLSEKWNTLLPISYYTESGPDDSPYEAPFRGEAKAVFPHDLPALKGTSFDLVRRTPFGNTMTKDLAVEAVKHEEMGRGTVPDFLCISFSATDYVGHQFGTDAIETEDTYLRLDKDLEDLLKQLDNTVGKGKYLLFLTADHAAAINPQHMEDEDAAAGFEGGVADTVKYFLQQRFGKKEYLRAYMNEQIYLDRGLLEKDSIDACVMEQQIAQFLREHVAGLADVVTGCQLNTEEYRELFRNRIQRGFMAERSGDICLLFQPGWTGRLFGNGKQGTTHGTPYPYDAQVPLYWFGWNIPHGSSTKAVNITDIAPTISYLLRCNVPNGCTGSPIQDIAR